MSNGTSWECANSYLELLLVKYDKIYLPYKFYYWRIGFPGKVLCAHINGHSANSTSYNCDSDSIFSGLDIDEYLAIIFKRLQGCRPQGCRWRLRRSCGHTELSLASRKFFYSIRNTKNQLKCYLLEKYGLLKGCTPSGGPISATLKISHRSHVWKGTSWDESGHRRWRDPRGSNNFGPSIFWKEYFSPQQIIDLDMKYT